MWYWIFIGTLLLVGILIVSMNYSSEKIIRYAKSAMLIVMTSKFSREIENAPTILVIGDSTGYGTGAVKKEDSIAGRIGLEYPLYSIVNMSKNGLKLEGLLKKFEEMNKDESYDLILLQIGGNDVLQFTEISSVEDTLRKVLVEAKTHSDAVVVMSSGNVGAAAAFAPYKDTDESIAYEAQTRRVREVFMNVSSENDTEYIDLFLESKDDMFLKEPKKYLAFDGLHPSSDGYGVWYKKLQPIISSLLSK